MTPLYRIEDGCSELMVDSGYTLEFVKTLVEERDELQRKLENMSQQLKKSTIRPKGGWKP